MDGIKLAIFMAGNQAKLAESLGVTQQMVSYWLRRGWVSPTRAREIEALYGIKQAKLINPRIAELFEPDSESFDDISENNK